MGGDVGDDVAHAMGAVQAAAEEVQSVQNKMQIDLTASLDDLVELEQLHGAIERLRVRTQTQNRLLQECSGLESRCKKAEERIKALKGD